MLAPNLKDGAGGLRDIQAPGWVGWALGPEPGGPGATPGAGGWSTGVATLVALGYLRDEDRTRLRERARPAARRPGRPAPRDRRTVGPAHAPGSGRGRAARRRRPTPTRWSASWERRLARSSGSRPTSGRACRAPARARRSLARCSLTRRGHRGPRRSGRARARCNVDAWRVLELAARAAELDCPSIVTRSFGSAISTSWSGRRGARRVHRRCSPSGRGAIPVFEALDHVGVLVRLLPEWEHVRARPQRNAYHRFTVDRHSLEAVAECVGDP